MSEGPTEKENQKLLLFPLSGIVLFPGMNLPLHIYEEKYKKMISVCLDGDKQFGVVYAKGRVCSEIGTKAVIVDVEMLQEGKMNILTEGKSRFEILNLVQEEPYYEANIRPYEDKESKVTSKLKSSLTQIRKISLKVLDLFDLVFEEELSEKLKLPKEPGELLFLISANLSCSNEQKQIILETRSIEERANKVLPLLKDELNRLEVLLANKKTKEEVIKNGKLKI